MSGIRVGKIVAARPHQHFILIARYIAEVRLNPAGLRDDGTHIIRALRNYVGHWSRRYQTREWNCDGFIRRIDEEYRLAGQEGVVAVWLPACCASNVGIHIK